MIITLLYLAWPNRQCLAQMARPNQDSHILLMHHLASSVAVERVFSRGRLVISHVRNRLSAQSTRALLCLGYWSKLDFVKMDDLKAAASLPDAQKDKSGLMMIGL